MHSDLDAVLGKAWVSAATYASLLRHCCQTRSLVQGKRVHDHISKSRYDGDTFLGNWLVELYGNCERLEDAKAAFTEIRKPNVFSWNYLIKAFIGNGCLRDASFAFQEMPGRDTVTWTLLLCSYAKHGHLQEASQMFLRMPEWDFVSWTSMVTAYAQSGQLRGAKEMFDEMPARDGPCWNAMLSAYSQNDNLSVAKIMFEKMPKWNVQSWNGMLSAFTQDCQRPRDGPRALAPDFLQEVFAVDDGGRLQEAKCLFDGMQERNRLSWVAMIGAFAEKRKLNEARELFERMPNTDLMACTTMLEVYTQLGHFEYSKALYDRMPEQDVVSMTTMMLCYASVGEVQTARSLFDNMTHRDVISWNAILLVYGENGYSGEALDLFWKMEGQGVKPDLVSLVTALDVCANSTSLAQGKLVHASAVDRGLDSSSKVGTALINMYGKCGLLSAAEDLFEKLSEKEVMAWTAMIEAYGYNGEGRKALMLFQRMATEGVEADHVLFVSVLGVCSHAGLFKHGLEHYMSLQGDFGMAPSVEHYVCVADLLSRAGRTSQAQELLETMPFDGNGTAWKLLLTSCKLHGDFGRAEAAAKRLAKVAPLSSATYVLLSQLYRARNTLKSEEAKSVDPIWKNP